MSFINELPHKLRIELAFRIHKKVLSRIPFFHEKPKDFIAFVGNLLHPMHAKPGQYIFQEDDPVLDSKPKNVRSVSSHVDVSSQYTS